MSSPDVPICLINSFPSFAKDELEHVCVFQSAFPQDLLEQSMTTTDFTDDDPQHSHNL